MFATGTFTDRLTCLTALKDNLTTDGWTINSWDASGAEYFLHAQLGTKMFFNARTNDGSELYQGSGGYFCNNNGILSYPSTAYSGAAAWDAQTGQPPNTPFYRFLPGLNVPGTVSGNYWYMSDEATYFIFIIKIDNKCQAIFLGDGYFAELPIFAASYWSGRYYATTPVYFSFFTQGGVHYSSHRHTHAYRVPDGSTEPYSNSTLSPPSGSYGSYPSTFFNAATNAVSGLPTLLPSLFAMTYSSTISYFDNIPDIAVFPTLGVASGTEAVYGSDTWVLFKMLHYDSGPTEAFRWIAVRKHS